MSAWVVAQLFLAVMLFALGFWAGRQVGFTSGSKQGFICALEKAVEVEKPQAALVRALLPPCRRNEPS